MMMNMLEISKTAFATTQAVRVSKKGVQRQRSEVEAESVDLGR
jgi:hypothetical protein